MGASRKSGARSVAPRNSVRKKRKGENFGVCEIGVFQIACIKVRGAASEGIRIAG
jgi:hypothetical protein